MDRVIHAKNFEVFVKTLKLMTNSLFNNFTHDYPWPVSWEICMQVRKQQLELDMEQQTGSKLGKEWVCQGYILSPCLFNLYVEYIMRNAKLDESQAGIKTAGRNISNLIYAYDTTLMAESKEELKSLLWRWKRRMKKLA